MSLIEKNYQSAIENIQILLEEIVDLNVTLEKKRLQKIEIVKFEKLLNDLNEDKKTVRSK